jgi:hypothetical protein
MGLKVKKLFLTRKEAITYHHAHCTGCGITIKVRATSENKKFKNGMDVTSDVSITSNWRRKKG